MNPGDTMKVSIFGATGALGTECVKQCLEAGHEVTVLVRTPSKLSREVRDKVSVIEGDGLDASSVTRALSGGTEAVLFAIGVDKYSPEALCTDVTRHILTAMRDLQVGRFVWCGGGSTIVEEDHISVGAKFVAAFARTFMGLRHRDKALQLDLLRQNLDLEWIGIRPLQMRKGPRRMKYRVGFDPFNGLSAISFADCAHAMLQMLSDDTWLHKAPIVQY